MVPSPHERITIWRTSSDFESQALNELDRRRDIYPDLLHCVTACFFFGVPFSGTDMTYHGLLMSRVFKLFGVKSYPGLLTLMEPLPRNAYLKKLCGDFKQLAARITPSIDLHCVYETVDIDFEYLLGTFGIPAKLANYMFNRTAGQQVSLKKSESSNCGIMW